MAVFDWPEALIPQTCIIGSQSAGEDFKSPYNGTLQQVDFVAERFTLNATLPQRRRANAGATEALLFRLRGGGNRVRAWHFSRPVPAGTLRGAPTLKTTVNRGASAVVLQNCRGTNVLLGGGFDVNGGGSGVAVGWAAYEAGSAGVVTRDQAAEGGGYVQRVFSTALVPAGRAGVGAANFLAVPGQTYTFSADVATGSGGVTIYMEVDWVDIGFGFISAQSHAVTPPDGNWQRMSFQAAAPANAYLGNVYIWMQGSGAAASLFIDDAQAAQGSTTVFTQTTLKAGDLIGLGTQLLMVAEDCTANDAGDMTVPLIHRVRSTITAGAAATWNKPTAEFTMPARFASVSHFPGGIESAALDLEEYWAP